jgi:hypothetical protein
MEKKNRDKAAPPSFPHRISAAVNLLCAERGCIVKPPE